MLLNNLFLVFFEGYIEIMLSSYLNSKGSVRETKSDQFSFVVSYIFGFVCLIIVPLSLLFMFSRTQETLDASYSLKSYGSLYDGLDTRFRWCLLFNFIFIIRRLLLLYIMFNKNLQIHNSLQIIYLVYLNFIIMMYVHISNPFRSK